MEPRSISARPDVTLATTSPRVTPTPPRASRFGEVLSSTVVRSAESAMRVLPGAPMMALAVRGAGGPGAVGIPMTPMAAGRGGAPEGPGAGARLSGSGASLSGITGATSGVSGSAAIPGTTGAETGFEASLQQSHDMNLTYLQMQEDMNAENRQFTMLSNILKARHDTVKTAIGNIRG